MKKYTITVIILIISFYCIWFLCVQGVTVDISKYKGDGIIKKIGAGYITRGYEIELDKNNLNNSFVSQYKLDGLPKLSRDYSLYLRVKKKSDTHRPKINGKYNIFVKDDEGKTLLSIRSDLSDWKQTAISNNSVDFYYLENGVSSSIDYKEVPSSILNVEVQFIAKEKTNPDDVSLIIRSGGSIWILLLDPTVDIVDKFAKEKEKYDYICC